MPWYHALTTPLPPHPPIAARPPRCNGRVMRSFSSFACIDWSGARGALLPGIAVAVAQGDDAPVLIAPPGGERAWSRMAVLGWLEARAQAGDAMLIGLDLSPSFPFIDTRAYFPEWDASPASLTGLWALVEQLCAPEPHLGANAFLVHPQGQRHFRHSATHVGDLFGGGIGRLRAVERHQRATRQANSWSCFNLVGAGQVGKSSLTGMRLLHRLAGRLPLWPHDPVPPSGPLLVEIYTSMAARAAGLPANRSKMRDGAALDAALRALGARPTGHDGPISDHASDALLTAAWLRATAHRPDFWNPAPLDAEIALTEGWTFGVI